MEKATVQSIDRALSIIETLAGEKEGLGVTEISTRVGLHKSTVHRLLSALGASHAKAVDIGLAVAVGVHGALFNCS